ncbi:putative membrane protein YesL [Evansella vedderi]|uniref:Membrane protein YesL n=1 Tax=Evansella vedderi TaxID=38282 RepID=A0ABT9ZPL2_9BACI|nr:YesL family protein [Evansella vedderi]MDQ0253177.1 putative membrane protein YesL [Evansella vedderi]
MTNTGLMGFLYRVSEWIMRLAYINLLWGLFTIIGLIIFGFAPATAASFAVIRKWFMGDTDIPIFRTFFKVYKEEFIKVNLLGAILGIVTFILYVDFLFVNTIDGIFRTIMSIGLITVSILFLIILLYIFPVYVHYKLKLFEYLKFSLMIGIINPLSTIMMIIGLLALYLVYIFIPGVIPFFGASLIFIGIMGPAYSSFKKMEQRKNDMEQLN